MKRIPPPPPSPERDRVIVILKDMLAKHLELQRILGTDKDWKKGLFPGVLFVEDDPRFQRWVYELCNLIRIPLDQVFPP